MKCEFAQQQILLAQSRELSWLGRQKLSRHLRDCVHCRQFESALIKITDYAHFPESELAVRADVMERIRSTARRENSRSEWIHIRPNRESFFVVFRPAIIYSAAAIMLLAGFWLMFRPALNPSKNIAQTVSGQDWDMASIDTQIETLNDWLDLAAVDEETTTTGSEDINTLARELLELEGKQI